MAKSKLSNATVELATTNCSREASRLLTVFLTTRSPTGSAELASRRALLLASPDLLQILCSITKFPCMLANDLPLTISPSDLETFARFILNSRIIDAFVPRMSFGVGWPRRPWDDVKVYFRKRKRNIFGSEPIPAAKRRAVLDRVDSDGGDGIPWPLREKMGNVCRKLHFHIDKDVVRSTITCSSDMPVSEFDDTNLNKIMDVASRSRQLFLKLENCKHFKDEKSSEMLVHDTFQQYTHTSNFQHSFCNMEAVPHLPNQVTVEVTVPCEPDLVPTLPTQVPDNLVLLKDEVFETNYFTTDLNVAYNPEVPFSNLSQEVDGKAAHASRATNSRKTEKSESIMKGKGEKLQSNFSSPTGEIKNLFLPHSTSVISVPSDESDFQKIEKVKCSNVMPSLNQEQATTVPPTKPFCISKQQSKSYAKMKSTVRNNVAPIMQTPCRSFKRTMVDSTLQEQQNCKRLATSLSMRQKPKQNRNDMHIKEKREISTSVSQKDQTKPEALPSFESFIVEEEEGSDYPLQFGSMKKKPHRLQNIGGGYGTVYRALRKSDGITVAIKCPHANANRHHINNELKMLERFGGKNFIIRYEGCFNSGNSDCFVLEHVEHDRPEVLKREVDIFQLQWYGYCMFRALSSLHKHGVVHRDVKPGNFLFSRKANRGCLIDFNLAKDLHQKSGITNKSKASRDVSSSRATIPSYKSVSPSKIRKFLSAHSSVAVNQEPAKDFKKLTVKSLNQKPVGQKVCNDSNCWTITKSQGGDGSGITSAKDATSTRNPAERAREPMPCQGRKELINLVHETIQSPNYEASLVRAPLRKRVAAHPEHLDRKYIYQGPMPLHSRGFGGMGSGLIKNKVDRKVEGSCAGTKGFRAPEVLFRSLCQGTKLDVWSAGVTLLFLMIGRAPFSGDPEQNIKEIAKLRGSEDLWEVAKLHNRESSFPVELYDTQFLKSTKLRDWCQANTKRLDLLKIIPRSLFDLVDKCLTVNPRIRISADEALRHEFFTPCHEALTKKRVLRQKQSLDSGTSRLSHGTKNNPASEGIL